MSVNSTSPAKLFGGTWVQLTGRFLIGVGPCGYNSTNYWGSVGPQDVYMPAGETGGEAWHVLTVNEIPSHSHQMPPWMWAVSAGWNNGTHNISGAVNGNAVPYNDGKSKQTQYSEAVGGGLKHNNLPPYLAVYMWKRTA